MECECGRCGGLMVGSKRGSGSVGPASLRSQLPRTPNTARGSRAAHRARRARTRASRKRKSAKASGRIVHPLGAPETAARSLAGAGALLVHLAHTGHQLSLACASRRHANEIFKPSWNVRSQLFATAASAALSMDRFEAGDVAEAFVERYAEAVPPGRWGGRWNATQLPALGARRRGSTRRGAHR